MITLFCQRDDRWKNDLLGKSQRTMGKFGCLVTSLAMLSSYYTPTHTPPEISKILSFNSDGKLIWRSAVFEHFYFDERLYHRDDVTFRQYLKDPNKAVIFEIGGGSHWVLGLSEGLGPNGYRIADPWLGDKTTIARYAGDITGAALFRRL